MNAPTQTTTTCIVALKEGGALHMMGDSAGMAGYAITTRSDPKVFRRTVKVVGGPNTEMLIGYTSSFRMGQLLRFKLEVPELDTSEVYRWMCTDFIDAVRKTFRDEGFARVDNNRESGGHFLVGLRGRLYEVEGDFQVAEHAYPYAAVGCGQDLALGALYGLQESEMAPEEKLHRALEAASEFSAGVRPPFVYESIEQEGE